MARVILVSVLLGTASASLIRSSTHNSNGYCWGRVDNAKGWCWLTWDGLKQYAKVPDNCASWNGYDSNDYCEDAKKKNEPTPVHHSKRDSGSGSRLIQILNQAVSSNHVNCHAVCQLFGSNSWRSSSSWSGSGASRVTDTTCTCGSHKIHIKCNGSPFRTCVDKTGNLAIPSPTPAPPPAATPSPATPAPGPAPPASGLGKCISDFAVSKTGQHVGSAATHYRQTECWDLAMAAIEHCNARGYNVPRGPSSYVWSRTTVKPQDSMPGDIAQFVSWNEKITYPGGGWATKSTGPRHTAVVTGNYNRGECAVKTHDQNPSPVTASDYHPCHKLGGSMIIYRLQSNARLYDGEDQWDVPEEFNHEPGHFSMTLSLVAGVVAASMAVVGFASFRAIRARRMENSVSQVDEELEELYPEEGLE